MVTVKKSMLLVGMALIAAMCISGQGGRGNNIAWWAAGAVQGAADTGESSKKVVGTEKDIQQLIKQADADGGGIISLLEGIYILHDRISLEDIQNVTIIGHPGGTELRAAKELVGTVGKNAAVGQKYIELQDKVEFAKGMTVEIQTQGAGKQDFFRAVVAGVDGTRIKLTAPLEYVVPSGTKVIGAYNGFWGCSGTANIRLEDITINMNREEWPIPPRNHTCHCAILCQGLYSYETGPVGAAVENFKVVNCIIKNAHHRGISWYNIANSEVCNCLIVDAGDKLNAEAIGFDHFARNCKAVGNTVINSHIELNDASDCLVKDNVIVNVKTGIWLWRWFTKLPNLCVRNKIVGNVIYKASKTGIRIAGDDNEITDNKMVDCAEGVNISGAGNIVLRNKCVEE